MTFDAVGVFGLTFDFLLKICLSVLCPPPTEAGVGGLGGIMGGGQPNRVNWYSADSLIPSDSEF